jgi:exonuclease SbcD
MVSHSWPDPTTGLPSRLLDVARCWHTITEQAYLREADAVIVAGDIFHTRSPDAAALTLFDAGLRILEAERIPVVIIPGNHDAATHTGRASVLEVFRSDLVRVVTKPEVVYAGDIAVACLPWVSRAQLTANSPGISREAAVEAQTEALERVLDDLRARGADVLTGHWSVQGAVLGSEADIAIVGESEPVIPPAALEGPWGYAALGHIHGHQSGAVGNTLWAYSGSVDRMNFGEEREDKIAWDVQLGADGVKSIVKLGLPARRFVTVEYLDDWSDYRGDDTDVEGAIVRIRARVTEGQDTAKLDRHARQLEEWGAARVYVQREIVRPTRARSERVTASLGLEESIAEWFDVADVSETDRPLLRDMAKSLAEETGS